MTDTQHRQSRAGLPSTLIGKRVGGLVLIFTGLLAWLIVGINFAGMEPGSLLAIVVGVSMLVVAAATLVTAVLSRFKFNDRSWVIVVGMIVPALTLALFAADIIAGE